MEGNNILPVALAVAREIDGSVPDYQLPISLTVRGEKGSRNCSDFQHDARRRLLRCNDFGTAN